MRLPLSNRTVLGLLMSWLPLLALLGALLLAIGRLRLIDVAVEVPIICLLFVFVARSSVYSVRALPIRQGRFLRVITVHVASAAVASGIWTAVVYLLGWAMSRLETAIIPIGTASELAVVFGVGLLSYLWTVTVSYLALAVDESRRAEEWAAESRSLALDAELKALRAQLNPHFLFNSLNSVAALTAVDPGKARRMCILLAEFLRRSLTLGHRRVIRLSEELDLVHAYLAVEAIRFEEKMTLKEKIDEAALEATLPPLLLQPLVENAVKHGIALLDSDGWIALDIAIVRENLRISIANPTDPAAAKGGGGGHGLRIVGQRLTSHFGPSAAIESETVVAEGARPVYRVRLSIPFNKETSS